MVIAQQLGRTEIESKFSVGGPLRPARMPPFEGPAAAGTPPLIVRTNYRLQDFVTQAGPAEEHGEPFHQGICWETRDQASDKDLPPCGPDRKQHNRGSNGRNKSNNTIQACDRGGVREGEGRTLGARQKETESRGAAGKETKGMCVLNPGLLGVKLSLRVFTGAQR